MIVISGRNRGIVGLINLKLCCMMGSYNKIRNGGKTIKFSGNFLRYEPGVEAFLGF